MNQRSRRRCKASEEVEYVTVVVGKDGKERSGLVGLCSHPHVNEDVEVDDKVSEEAEIPSCPCPRDHSIHDVEVVVGKVDEVVKACESLDCEVLGDQEACSPMNSKLEISCSSHR